MAGDGVESPRVTCHLQAGHIARVRPERQHEKQPAEHILAFRHPRHRFHPQRMYRKHRRHKRAAPQKPRHPPQNQKKQDRCCRVEEDIGQMMPAGIQSIQLAVQHVGQHRQRMPVGHHDMGEGPLDSFQAQPAGDHGIFIYVPAVVVVNKLIPQCLAEDHPDNCRQKNADSGYPPAVIQTRRRAFGFQPAGVFHFRHFTGGRSGWARMHGSGFFLRTSAHEKSQRSPTD